MSNLPTLNRAQLAKVFKDQQSLTAFADLFSNVADTLPALVSSAQTAADSANAAAVTAQGTADSASASAATANASVASLSLQVDTLTGQVTAILAIPIKFVDAATPIRSTVSLTDYAGALLGTLANSPVAGNPTKWIAFDDNGTTRYLPLW